MGSVKIIIIQPWCIMRDEGVCIINSNRRLNRYENIILRITRREVSAGQYNIEVYIFKTLIIMSDFKTI